MFKDSANSDRLCNYLKKRIFLFQQEIVNYGMFPK